MNIVRSAGQSNVIYVMLTDSEAETLRKELPKKSLLRMELKKVLRGK